MTELPISVVPYTSGPTPEPFDVRRSGDTSKGAFFEHALKLLTLGSALLIFVMLGALLAALFWAATPSIRQFGAKFLVGSDWRPNELQGEPKKGPDGKVLMEDGEVVTETIPPAFGALPVIYGTVISSALALVIAVPLSFGTAIFLVRIATRRLVAPVSFLVEFLAAIPSIAYGIWGLFVLCPLLQGGLKLWHWLDWLASVPGLRWAFEVSQGTSGPGSSATGVDTRMVVSLRGLEPMLKDLFIRVPGFGWLFNETVTTDGHQVVRPLALTGHDMFAGSVVLAIMIVPIITAISRDVLRSVPRAQLEGTVALGATWWESSVEMLKFSRSALFGAVMLGLARAAGETMAITMVIGNSNQIRSSIFAPAQTMSSLLANEFAEASTEIHRAALTEVALILLLMSLVFNIVARYLVVGKQSRSAAGH